MWETMDFENRKEFSLDKKLINQDNCYSLKFSTISIHNNGTNTERESKNVDRSVFCYKTVSMSDSLSLIYGTKSVKQGDILGLKLDMSSGSISFVLNGKDMGVAL